MLEKNTKQVNRMMTRIFAVCAIPILLMVICSYYGVFEFGTEYTRTVFIAGLLLSISPSALRRFLPDDVLKYYMLGMAAIFIGILGTSNHIGIYITYILVPVLSCLYFEPYLVVESSIFSYIFMLIALYINSAGKYEVVAMGMSRTHIFIAYALGFTIEYVIVGSVLYLIVKRAKNMMEERNNATYENRMKSTFLSNMSHEIRTPMNAIIGMTDVALRRDMDEDLRKDLTVIKSSSTGLLEIVNDILDLSKVEAGKVSVIEEDYTTRSLVDDAIAVIDARNIEHRVPIYYHVQKDMPQALRGDAVRIKQVMLNYASNAIKYTESGQIDVFLSCEQAGDGIVNLIYKVKDTGYGIKEENLPKLFTMYSQFDEQRHHGKEGTGIGLAISKTFVDKMNGTVAVESVYGKGSTFSFSIPQKIITLKECEAEQQSAQENVQSFVTRDARILVTDDNEINRSVLQAILEPFQMTIDEAENGKEAVEKAKKNAYDLIFMDSHMPVMDGAEATKLIRELEVTTGRHTPIVATTADAITGVREQLLAAGMDDYIVKPIDIPKLSNIIQTYLPKEKIIYR